MRRQRAVRTLQNNLVCKGLSIAGWVLYGPGFARAVDEIRREDRAREEKEILRRIAIAREEEAPWDPP